MFSIPCWQPLFQVAAAGHNSFSNLVKSMVREGVLRVAASLLVSLGLLGGGAFGATGDSLRKIVVFRDGTSEQVQQQVVARSGSQLLNFLSLVTAATITLPSESVAQALAMLQSDPAVTGVYDDLTVSGQDGGGDNVIVITPAYPPTSENYPWGLKAIHVPEVHIDEPGLKGAGVTVAILDTGIDVTHPDLSKNIKGGYNALAGQDPQNYQDDNGHGTHMAGIIAARINNYGIIGAAYQAKILAVKVLDQNGGGRLSDLINGLGWIRANKIKIANMSLGFSEDSPLLVKAIERLYEAGVIMVASAGNQGVTCAQDGGGDDGGGDDGGGDDGGGDSSCQPAPGGVNFPARYSQVISVVATNDANEVTGYSQSGEKVDIAAPGGTKSGPRILSTHNGGGYGWGSGTSQAAAHVSGAITLLLQKNPKMSFNEVLTLLQSTAKDLNVPAERQGAGLIDVEAMVNALR